MIGFLAFDISEETRANIGTGTIYIVHYIMATQMLASVLMCCKTIYAKYKKKKLESMSTRVIPISQESMQLQENNASLDSEHLRCNSPLQSEGDNLVENLEQLKKFIITKFRYLLFKDFFIFL